MASKKWKIWFLPLPMLVAGVAMYAFRHKLRPAKTCVAKTFSGRAPAEQGPDQWPSLHGPSMDGASVHRGPADLAASLAWKWHHPQGRFYTVLNGVVIDGSSCLYVSGSDEVVKLSPDGAVLWTYCSPGGPISAAPTLMDGGVYGSTTSGVVYALDASTGEQRWSVRVAGSIGFDTHAVAAHGGRLIVPTDPVSTRCCGWGGGSVLRCLNATTGGHLWEFRLDAAVWNFHAAFFDDGSFCFQDLEGRAYCSRQSDGELLWKRGGMAGTWNDGSLGLGPGGLVYAVTTQGDNLQTTPGVITAYRRKDGEQVWEQQVPHPPNQFPAVGRLRPGANLSVVLSIGTYSPSAVYGLDALTGAVQWRLPGPPAAEGGARGDMEGLETRTSLGFVRAACMPNAWSNPSVDADGTVYIGHSNGFFFAARDRDGDGRIDLGEVSSFDGEAGFPGAAPALAKGMVAIASCDTLFVFKA